MFRRNKRRSLEDFSEELRSHISLEADRLRERDHASDNPEEHARKEMGNMTEVKESFYEKNRWLVWDHLIRDLTQAFRMMKRKPGFSTIVIATLALGIGANTAIFSLVNAVLLRPLPYQDPSRLAMVWSDDPDHNDHEVRVSLPDFNDWKAQNRSFEDMTFFAGQTFLLGADGSPERMRSARVPANFFSMLGVQPVLGRVFSSAEEQTSTPVVLLSYRLWQRQFGGSRQVIGTDIMMDERKSHIIGVMPEGFQFPFPDTQVWEPVTAHRYWHHGSIGPRTSRGWYVLGRLKKNVTWPQAQAEMSSIGQGLRSQYGDSQGPFGVRIVPLAAQSTGKVRTSLYVLFSAVFLMLLIACINVANLLLARGTAREREFSLRRALGASRVRVTAQLLTETMVLSLVGGMLGVALAVAGLRALIAFGPQDIPRLAEAHIDSQALIFAVALSILAALASGIWPALQNDGRAAASRQWMTVGYRGARNLLVTGQFSLALILLAGAGLLIHSFLRMETVDLGYRPENLLVMHIDLHVGKQAPQRVAYFRDAIDRVQSLPGVRSAGAVGRMLKTYGLDPFVIEGRANSGGDFQAAQDVVSGAYFQTAGIPLKRGRFFSDADRADSLPVIIINETMARKYWGSEDSIGKRLQFPDSGKPGPWLTIVGVTGDVRRPGVEKEVVPQSFQPHTQNPDNEFDLVVRTASDPLTMESAIREAVQSMDRSVAKFGIATVEQRMGEQNAERRFDTSLLALFSLIALLLSAIGIYGLMHHFVAQRTNEIGVRMALGAQYRSVLILVLREGVKLAAIGTVVGIGGALMVTRLLSSMLYGVTPTDLITFSAAPAVLLGAALLACWIPARRAARIDPMAALRQD